MVLDGETIDALAFASVETIGAWIARGLCSSLALLEGCDAVTRASSPRPTRRSPAEERAARRVDARGCRRRAALTSEQRRRIGYLARSGKGATEIARAIGVHRNMVRNYLEART